MNGKNLKGRDGIVPALPRRAEETRKPRALPLRQIRVMTSCGLVQSYKCFAGTCGLRLQDIYFSSVLKMEAAGFSEIFSWFYQAIRRRILDENNRNLNSNHQETLRSQWN
jgi:hypothetical protein